MKTLKQVFSILLAFMLVLFMFPVGTSFASSAVQTTVYNYLKNDMALNTASACGVLGNIRRESSFDCNCYGDNGKSYGICQWQGSRLTNLKNFCSSRGLNYTTLNAQLQFMYYEMIYGFPGVYDTLKTKFANTLDGAKDAAEYMCRDYEGPADMENDVIKSRNYAAEFWSTYGFTESDYPTVTVSNEYCYEAFSSSSENANTAEKNFNINKDITVDYYDPKGAATGYKYKVLGLSSAPSGTESESSSKIVWTYGDGSTLTTKKSFTIPNRTIQSGNCHYIKIAVACVDGGGTEKWRMISAAVSPAKPSINNYSNEQTISKNDGIYATWSSVPNGSTYGYKVIQLTGSPNPGSNSESYDNIWTKSGTSQKSIEIPSGNLVAGRWYKLAIYATDSVNGTDSWNDPFYIYVKNSQAYTLTYNANNGSGAPSAQTGSTSYTIASSTPTRSGYTFLGWSTSSYATSASYTAGNSITLTKDTTLYAVWQKNPVTTYTLTYNANNGSGAPSAQTGSTSYTIASSTPTRSGYTFLGWATSSSATSEEYTAGNSITLTKNTTLYAVWKINGFVRGDIDGDGEVSDWDEILLERYLANWDVSIIYSAADMDGDGEISDWDEILLERQLAGWNINF